MLRHVVQLNTASCEPCCSPGLAFSPPATTSNILTVRKHFTQSVFNAPTFFIVVWSWISRCAVLFSSALVSALRWLNLRFHLIRAPATRYASLMPALGQPSSLFLVSVSHRRQSATRVASGSSMCTFFFSFIRLSSRTHVCVLPSFVGSQQPQMAQNRRLRVSKPALIQSHLLAPSNNTRTTIVNPVYRTTGQS